MRKVAVAPAIVLTCLCLTLGLLVIDGPTAEWWFPIALALPALTMSVVCFDQRLPIGHYALTVTIATLGIYWIALGVGGYAATILEGTPQETAILRAVGSNLPGWRGIDKSMAFFFATPISLFLVVMGFIWLLPTRRIWDSHTPIT